MFARGTLIVTAEVGKLKGSVNVRSGSKAKSPPMGGTSASAPNNGHAALSHFVTQGGVLMKNGRLVTSKLMRLLCVGAIVLFFDLRVDQT